MSDSEKSAPAEVSAVAVKLPPFWTHNPDLWFQRAECQFRLKKITSQQTMFDYVLNVMSEDMMKTVRKAIDDPDDETCYDDLKQALIARHKPNRICSFVAFYASPAIGPGQDPTTVADAIEAFNIKKDLEAEIGMFLSKMPDLIRHDLMKEADDYESLQELAKAAKKLMGKASSEVVLAVTGRSYHQSGRQQRRQDYRQQQQQGICLAHQRYGNKARTCTDWCGWSKKRGVKAIEMEQSENFNLSQ